MLWPLLSALVTGAVAVGAILKSRLSYDALPELPEAAARPESDVAVIVPARNEEGWIGRCVSSFRDVKVMVADDGSGDGTRAEAESAGARIVTTPPAPKYWLGKANACWNAAQECAQPWLLFADADTTCAPEFVSSLLNYARERELIGVSVLARQEAPGFLASTLAPYAMGLYFTGISTSAVNHHLRPAALARGEWFLIRRDAYIFLQGHRAVASQVLDDIALARLMKRHRMKLHVVRAERMARVRLRETLPSFFKSTLRLLRYYPGAAWAPVAAMLCLASWVPVAAWLAWEGLWEVGALYCVIPLVVWAPWYGWRQVWRAPLAMYLFPLLAALAAVRTVFGVATVWKGRPV